MAGGKLVRVAKGSRQSARQMASKALSVAKKVERKVGTPEVHRIQGSSTTELNTTAQVQSLCIVAQGDNASNRSGNQILPKYLTVRLNMEKQANGNLCDIVRWIIFRDNASGSVAPTVTDILDTNTPNSLRNWEGDPKRFNILHDSFHRLDGLQASGYLTDHTSMHKTVKLPLAAKPVYYDGTTGSAQVKGCIYNLLVTTASSTPTYGIAKELYWELRYTDL